MQSHRHIVLSTGREKVEGILIRERHNNMCLLKRLPWLYVQIGGRERE